MPSTYPPRQPDAPGVLVAVVGPSGAGKDTLIGYARERLAVEPGILFVRRVVTRQAIASTEDHDSLSPAEFMVARASGAFAVSWEAHGLHYAIPSEALRHVGGGGVAVVNGSRAALPAIRAAFARIMIVVVTCRADVLAARLAARGREGEAERGARIVRAGLAIERPADSVEIDNSGDASHAGDALVAAIRGAAIRR